MATTKEDRRQQALTEAGVNRVLQTLQADTGVAKAAADALRTDPRAFIERMLSLTPRQQAGLRGIDDRKLRDTFAKVARALAAGEQITATVDLPPVTPDPTGGLEPAPGGGETQLKCSGSVEYTPPSGGMPGKIKIAGMLEL